ncbi:MAG: 3-phosphoshikimate 1-carboxyvinyltransferase [Pyrinomonadaceae bacterium]
MTIQKLRPANSLIGTIHLPGDKSISHRAAILSAMAEGETRIENFAASQDCSSTLGCLSALGVQIDRRADSVVIDGLGKRGFRRPAALLDCGNSGTTMRLMAGMLAGQAFDSTLTGDDSLSRRPMGRVIEPLSLMGAQLVSSDGRAPLTIGRGGSLIGIEYTLPVASAQIKSCILLAGLNATGKTTVVEPVATRDHTERMLRWLGADVLATDHEGGCQISVSGDSKLSARNLSVPADISSGAFLMVAAACLPGSRVEMPKVGLNPSRRAILDVLTRSGADIEIGSETEECGEPVATIVIRGGLRDCEPLKVLRDGIIANLIDEIPILAVLGTQLKGGLEIRDAAELRVKESDRIRSVVMNLRKMGAHIEEFADGFRVEKSALHGTEVDSFADHRVGMAFAIAGLVADGETTILGAECADVSFPRFFETLESVVR